MREVMLTMRLPSRRLSRHGVRHAQRAEGIGLKLRQDGADIISSSVSTVRTPALLINRSTAVLPRRRPEARRCDHRSHLAASRAGGRA